MEVKEIQKKKKEVITDILCDCCGKSCRTYKGKVNNDARVDDGEESYFFEYMKLHNYWGYHSNKDEEEWTAHVCEKCVDEKLSFVKFTKTRYNAFSPRKK